VIDEEYVIDALKFDTDKKIPIDLEIQMKLILKFLKEV
jgi:hypothetical protein